MAELFQELQNKYWEPICDRFTAWPLILGKDYIVEMTDLFEMDSVVFEGKKIRVKSHDTFAWTLNERFESRAKIRMNIHMIQSLPKEEFEVGIFLHELGHVVCVKCRKFNCNHRKTNCNGDDPECPDYLCQSLHHIGLWLQYSEVMDSKLGSYSPKTSVSYTNYSLGQKARGKTQLVFCAQQVLYLFFHKL